MKTKPYHTMTIAEIDKIYGDYIKRFNDLMNEFEDKTGLEVEKFSKYENEYGGENDEIISFYFSVKNIL